MANPDPKPGPSGSTEPRKAGEAADRLDEARGAFHPGRKYSAPVDAAASGFEQAGETRDRQPVTDTLTGERLDDQGGERTGTEKASGGV